MNRPNTTRMHIRPLDACFLPNQSSADFQCLTGIHICRSHAHLVLGMLAGVFLLVAVAGCTPRSQFHARFEPAECRFDVPAGETVECGDLVVPEDRDSRTPAEIKLHVARVRSHNAAPLPDPIVFLQGGPGGHTQPALEGGGFLAFKGLLAERDLIFYDQRGVGHSQPALECPELGDALLAASSLSWGEEQAHRAAALAACADRLRRAGHDLSAYNSLASAADLEDLRRALGYESWNLLAYSYGTRLALTAMREYPKGIRSVLLDSVVPLQVDPYSEVVLSLQRSLDVLFERCQLDTRCAQAFPDLRPRYWRLVDHLNAEPVHTRVFDPSTGRGYDVAIDGHRLLDLTRVALYNGITIRELPLLLAELEQRRISSTLRGMIMSQLSVHSYLSHGMYSAVACREGVHIGSTGAGLAAVQELTSQLLDHQQLQSRLDKTVCEAWDVPPAPASESQPVVSAIPTLLLAGAFDPATPPAWARLAAETLSASQTVEFPGAGHAPFFEFQCARIVVTAFFDKPGSAVDSSCVDALPQFFRQR